MSGQAKSREERIRERAYELWEQNGRTEGQAEEHWHQARREIGAEDEEPGDEGSAGSGPADLEKYGAD